MMASFLVRSALASATRSCFGRCSAVLTHAGTGSAVPRTRALVASTVRATVSASPFSTNAPLAAADLPANLVIEGLEDLAAEPETEFNETELLRADLSKKEVPVVFLKAPVYEDDEPAPASASSAEEKATVVLDNRVFGVPIRRDLVHRVVVWQRARWRAGTAHTKTRAEVSGGGKRPWKQKGGGRARHGSIRSPIWRGGGKAHGKKRRDFSIKLNRKVRQAGMRVALASKFREGNLFVVDVRGVESRRTGDLVATLEDAEVFEEDGSVMLVDGDEQYDADDDDAYPVAVAARNLPWVSVYPQRGANVYAILKHHRLFITREALDQLTERLTRL
jgi:large subunit ribosomal protein L4